MATRLVDDSYLLITNTVNEGLFKLLKGTQIVAFALMLSFAAPIQAWEPFELRNGQIRIASSIEGVEGYSIIDTGAEINAINSIFLHEHGLDFRTSGEEVIIEGVFGEETRSLYREVPVSLYGVDIPFRDLVDLNLRDKDLQLLLGAPFLRLFVVQFDYPNQRMRVIPRKSLNMKKLKNVRSRRDEDGGSPIVQVKLDGKPVWLTLDTGNAGGMIVDRSIATNERWLDKYQSINNSSYGAITSGEKLTFNISSIEFGPFELENPIVSVPPEGESWNLFQRRTRTGSHVRSMRGKARGLLGYDVLKHFVVTIDYKSGAVHIAPPA